jgi:hypothetical protein
MILKLIETNTTPKIGDLVQTEEFLIVVTEDNLQAILISQDKVVKPYGISDDEVTGYGLRLDVERNTIGIIDDDDWYRKQPDKFKKVNILPEQFNYQGIVYLGLKDGDALNGYFHMPFDGKVPYEISLDRKQNTLFHITKPTPVTYTEEEVFALIKLLGEDFSIEVYVGELEEWFNLNKKKV